MHEFRSAERLTKRTEYLRLSAEGRKVLSKYFVILYLPTPGQSARIGITVSRRVGCAVIRNRLKRRVREFFRQNKGLFGSAEFSMIARQGAGNLDTSQVWQEIRQALGRVRYV